MNIWIIAIVFIAICAYLYFKQKDAKEEEYERTAGKILRIGDTIPKWIVKEKWKSIGIVPVFINERHVRDILICQLAIETVFSKNIGIELLLGNRLPQGVEIFQISETGILKFNC